MRNECAAAFRSLRTYKTRHTHFASAASRQPEFKQPYPNPNLAFDSRLRSSCRGAMTRVTNFGIKRTYLEAGFSNDETPSTETVDKPSNGINDPSASSEVSPPKKKRKRTPKSKRDGNLTKEPEGEAEKNGSDDVTVKSSDTTVPATGKSAKKRKPAKIKRNKERSKSLLIYS